MATVPAYRSYLEEQGWRDRAWTNAAERIASLPETDKSGYIVRYPTAERCVGGAIPTEGVEIDESSGSSGRPFSWVRSQAELHQVHLSLRQLAKLLLGKRIVTINAFSMGAWATGTNVSAALAHNGIIKSPGPDPEKILSALELLGPKHRYVICGYPPFLKELLDYGEENGVDWDRFKMFGVVGGEGMSETLRARLEQRFVAVYSAYGASDLDIGVAGEFPLSVYIRKQAAQNPELRRALFGDDPRLPMLFQYNPLDYYVETNDSGELVITVNRLAMLSPRIRYNIHDAGGARSFRDTIAICREFGIDPVKASREASGVRAFRLPFLWVHGRSDSTLSYMGANIYPEDVEQALCADSGSDATRLGAYCLELVDFANDEVRPCVHVEVTTGPVEDPDLAARLVKVVVERLSANSRDVKAAVAEDPRTAEVLVRLHAPGSGPFAGSDARIKRRYVIKR
jgi:phenylacetate-CoA ligase